MGGIGTTIWRWLKAAKGWLGRVFTPSAPAWTAAAWALLALWGLLVLSFLVNEGVSGPTWETAVGAIVFYGVLALASGALLLLVWLLGALKLRYRAALLLALPPVLLIGFITWAPKGAFIAAPLALIGLSLLFGAGAALLRRGTPRPRRIGAVVFFALGVVMLEPPRLGAAEDPGRPQSDPGRLSPARRHARPGRSGQTRTLPGANLHLWQRNRSTSPGIRQRRALSDGVRGRRQARSEVDRPRRLGAVPVLGFRSEGLPGAGTGVDAGHRARRRAAGAVSPGADRAWQPRHGSLFRPRLRLSGRAAGQPGLHRGVGG